MVDNRSAGFYGVPGSFNFKSGDTSGTAAKMSEEKYGSDAEYMRVEEIDSEDALVNKFVDKSAQLNATLSSLAMLNISSVISSKLPKIKKTTKKFTDIINETEERLLALTEEQEDEKEKEKKRNLFKNVDDSSDNDEKTEDDEYY